ncbi:hypothetical protein C8J56DRAFT_1162269 [Mycena floridula]|nr:hypothetical protein C8J56DRAFT_1162269 [Mycena floridula]
MKFTIAHIAMFLASAASVLAQEDGYVSDIAARDYEQLAPRFDHADHLKRALSGFERRSLERRVDCGAKCSQYQWAPRNLANCLKNCLAAK